jgi:hypothetical protein
MTNEKSLLIDMKPHSQSIKVAKKDQTMKAICEGTITQRQYTQKCILCSRVEQKSFICYIAVLFNYKPLIRKLMLE